MEKKKPCKSCKKGKEVTELPQPIDILSELPPTYDEVKDLYITMSSMGGVTPEDYERINPIYKRIFNEDLLRSCGSCGRTQYRKLSWHIKNVLNLDIE